MAQNITLLGASYSDVPSVVLPKTGGGTAQFDDTSDANATAADIASGKTAYVNGAKVTGTASDGGTASKFNIVSSIVWVDGYFYDNSGAVGASSNAKYEEEYIPIQASTEYSISFSDNSANRVRIHTYNASKTRLNQIVNTTEKTATFTTESTAAYIRMSLPLNATNVLLTTDVTQEIIPTKIDAVYHPSATDQTITSGQFLIGDQTIKATSTNLTADKIVNGFVAKIGDTTDDDCVASIVGTYTGGGGGLEYETGTWTPAEDATDYNVQFANTHSTPPFFASYMLQADYDNTLYSPLYCAYTNLESVYGSGYYTNSTDITYGRVDYQYRGSNATAASISSMSIVYPLSNTSTSSASYPWFWVTNTYISLHSRSASRYFRAGKTYKWIAVWSPST